VPRPEPLSEEVRRMRRRVPRGTYKYGPDEIAQARKRLRGFERIKRPTELQKKEKYRLQAILRGRAPALKRDVGAARVGPFGGPPGPQAVVQAVALAAAPAAPGFIGASVAARGVLATAARLGAGGVVATGRMAGGGRKQKLRPYVPPREIAKTRLESPAEEARRIRRRIN